MSATVLSATAGTAFGISLLIVVVFCYRKVLKRDVTPRVFILYSNHYDRDCEIAKAFKNFLYKVDGVQVLYDKSDLISYIEKPKKVHEDKMAACTHVMVIWSPGAREALNGGFLSQPETPVQDLFKSSLSWFSNLDGKCYQKAFIVYLPGYEKIESLKSLPKILRNVKKFNITQDKEVKKLCKYLIGRIPTSLLTKTERTKAINEITMKLNMNENHSIEESEHSSLLPESNFIQQRPMTLCPVHGPNVINLNCARSKFKTSVSMRGEKESRTVKNDRNVRKESPEIIIHTNGNNSRPDNHHHQPVKRIYSDESYPKTRHPYKNNLQISADISEDIYLNSFESCSSGSFSSQGKEMSRINFPSQRPSVLTYPYISSDNFFSDNSENIELHDQARHILPCTNINSDGSDEMDKYTSGYCTTSFQNQNMELQKHHVPSRTFIRTDVANKTTNSTNSLSSQGDDAMSRSIMNLMLDFNEIM